MLNIKVECAQTPTNRSNTVKKSGLKLLHNTVIHKEIQKVVVAKGGAAAMQPFQNATLPSHMTTQSCVKLGPLKF